MDQRKNTLKLGKLSKNDLDRLVLNFLPIDKKVELDGAVIDLKEEAVIAHSPSIGVPNDALGFFAFHYSASNVAVKFGIPIYMVIGLYLPLKTPETDLKMITKNLGREAEKYGVKIVAGQTATYNGLETPIITSTCIGHKIRKTEKPGVEDIVVVIGEIGGESLWLKSLSEGCHDPVWKDFTPLPAALALQKIEGVRLMHDISEGGLIGALYEISQDLGFRIDLGPDNLRYVEGSASLGRDIFYAPTYGSLIAITSPDSLGLVEELCEKEGYPIAVIGSLKTGKGVYVKGEIVREQVRVDIDKIYGSFKVGDEVVNTLSRALESLACRKEFVSLIPEVGVNMVYAKSNPKTIQDIAALSGRCVKAVGKPLLCGEVVYGGSQHLANVVLAASKIAPSMRSAVNIKSNEAIIRSVLSNKLNLVKIPSKVRGKVCPVVDYIEENSVIADAYYHPGAFSIESTITLLAETPDKLVKILLEIIVDEQNKEDF